MKKLILSFIIFTSVWATIKGQTCLPDGILFDNQEQIDNFQSDYPNCIKIEGDVIIQGSEIKNLEGLSVLTTIRSNLGIFDNDSLSNLNGLNNLVYIGGNLKLESNFVLTNLSGLDNLITIGTYLQFVYNPVLENINALNKLSEIGGSIIVYDNDSLKDLNGLNNLHSVPGSLLITHNNTLQNLIGLNNVTSIGAQVVIEDNYSLYNMEGLNSLTNIEEYLDILNNPSLDNLSGLENLSSTGYSLRIHFNKMLNNISALKELKTIDGNISVRLNPKLKSLEGLDNITANTIENLRFYENELLSACSIKSVCIYLADSNASIIIRDNAVGCNNREEIRNDCGNLGVSTNSIKNAISIYPTPTKSKLFINVDDELTINEINIFNQTGQKVIQQDKLTKYIDVSNLRNGLYVLELVTNEFKIRKKFINVD